MHIKLRLVEVSIYRFGFNRKDLYVQVKGFWRWDNVIVEKENKTLAPLKASFHQIPITKTDEDILIGEAIDLFIPNKFKHYQVTIEPKIFVSDFDFSS